MLLSDVCGWRMCGCGGMSDDGQKRSAGAGAAHKGFMTTAVRSVASHQIRADSGGMDPCELDTKLTLARAEAEAHGTKPPRLLYTVRGGLGEGVLPGLRQGSSGTNEAPSAPVHSIHLYDNGLLHRRCPPATTLRASGWSSLPLASVNDLYASSQVPTGHNPTGIVMSEERKRALYRVCQKHSLIIIEDDAYYWLQFYRRQQEQRGEGVSPPQQGVQEEGVPGQEQDPSQQEGVQQAESPAASKPALASEPIATSEPALAASSAPSLDMDGVPGLDLPASFLSIDTDGRVVRVDTLSKLMGPG